MKLATRHLSGGLILMITGLLLFTAGVSAQETVRWTAPYRQVLPDGRMQLFLNCEGSGTNPATGLPGLTYLRDVPGNVVSVGLTAAHYAPLSAEETLALNTADLSSVAMDPVPDYTLVYDRGTPKLRIQLLPLRRNPSDAAIEKLVSFDFKITCDGPLSPGSREQTAYASASVLSKGDWFRVSVSESGIARLTYSDLAEMGMQMTGLSSSVIRVFGYGGGMLPERAGTSRFDDLPEVPVKMVDGGDGTFDPGDYLLFYAQGPDKWTFNGQTGLFEHQTHLYTDVACYFVTAGETPGLRMQEFIQPLSAPLATVTSYNWFGAREPDEYNMIKSGKQWYGDLFDVVSERRYSFGTMEPVPQAPLSIRLSAVARSTQGSSFTLNAAGASFNLYISPIVTDYNTAYAKQSTETFEVENPDYTAGFSLKYNKSLSSSMGWLNFIEVNGLARLAFTGGQLAFRKSGLQGVVEYKLTIPDKPFQLWDVTDPHNPGYLNASVSGSTASFTALADTLREYVISDEQSYLKPVFVEKTANQNLHGMAPVSMLIISHPAFTEEAMRLATFHAQHDDLSVAVVEPQTIYNEFSSGVQDISAIRDFVRMLYIRSQGQQVPRYLLFVGDASYDPKDRLSANSNFIPTFQSPESLHPVTSYATDDFFGCLDDGEGGLASDVPDVGIGRLPVQSVDEARMAVDKIIHYCTPSEKTEGDWRNVVTFVADDGDGNSHMQQADMIATMIDTTYRNYNVDKIYFDAYNQVSTPGGQRIPDATAAINQRMDKGALIVNYTGHGGEVGWAHERVLEVADINSWTNYDRMPVFMTATCEFSRYDDPALQSAGELVFLNPNGGGIALFTTSRPTFGTPNFSLARSFYSIAFSPVDGGMPRLGDLIRISKMSAGADNNSKKFILLGDPAMKMAYPENRVLTLEVNGRDASGEADTLKALSQISISGIVADEAGNKLSDFNGTVIPVVFDKESLVNTFGTEGASSMTFSLRRNIIYKGKVNVENGVFSFSFIVPRDIAYQFGKGKISYYAYDGNRDAAGHFENVVVGGFSERQLDDLAGPDIDLFMNDRKFRKGGFTDQNPVMIADVRDLSGVNTIGNSIGHDIVAILDEQTNDPYILNDYYQSDFNTYQSGVITFPFHNLSQGAHTLRLKVWDVNNNSSEVTTTFVVAESDGLTLGNFDAWPNPMSDRITFEFEHNQAGQELNVQLDIFTLSGNRAATLNRRIFAEGFRTTGFEWDGRGSDGHLLSGGFYIGRLTIRTDTGLSATKSVKVIIAR